MKESMVLFLAKDKQKMAQGQPETIAGKLTQELDLLTANSVKYLDPKRDLTVFRLMRECEKLLPVDAFHGNMFVGLLWGLCGDVDKARNCFEAVKTDDIFWLGNYSLIMANLGYFNEARSMAEKACDPQRGGFLMFCHRLLFCGGFHAIGKQLEQFVMMGNELPTELPQDAIKEIILELQAHGLDDEYVAKQLDVAGNILRKHKCLPLSSSHGRLVRWELAPPLLHIKIAVSLALDEIVEMNFELAQAFAKRQEPMPELIHISFEQQQ